MAMKRSKVFPTQLRSRYTVAGASSNHLKTNNCHIQAWSFIKGTGSKNNFNVLSFILVAQITLESFIVSSLNVVSNVTLKPLFPGLMKILLRGLVRAVRAGHPWGRLGVRLHVAAVVCLPLRLLSSTNCPRRRHHCRHRHSCSTNS